MYINEVCIYECISKELIYSLSMSNFPQIFCYFLLSCGALSLSHLKEYVCENSLGF